MPGVKGIGGVFIYAEKPQELASWYTSHLGLTLTYDPASQNYFQEFWSGDLNKADLKLQTVFAIMPAPERLGPARGETMINYRVDDLDELVAQLRAAGIVTGPVTLQADGQGQGKFVQLKDPEGNRIELWEHVG